MTVILTGCKEMNKSYDNLEEALKHPKHVVFLEVGNKPDSSWFSSLKKMKNLEHLTIKNCSIDSLEKLGDLPKLRTIKLYDTTISNFNEEINYLQNIKELMLYNVDIEFFNPHAPLLSLDLINIQNCQHLKKIDLTKVNNVSRLWISCFENIYPIVSGIETLKNLTLVNIENVASLDGQFLTGENLQEVRLNDVLSMELPEKIENVQNLHILGIVKVKLSKKYKQLIVSLPALRDFALIDEDYSATEIVFDTPNLSLVHLDGLNLMKIPPTLYICKKIKYLYLGNNKLSSIPKEIVSFENLQELDLHNNKLQDFPKELLQLKWLGSLDVRGNPIFTLPDELKSSKIELLIDEHESVIRALKKLGHTKLINGRWTYLPKEMFQ